MRRIKIVGVCLVAALAFGVLVGSAAPGAAPEWGHCVAMKKSKYTDKNCSKLAKPGKGSYEWVGGAQGCYAVKKGEYTTSACTTKSSRPKKGAFEKTLGGKFTSESTGPGVLKSEVYVCENGEEESLGRLPRAECNGKQYTNTALDEIECEGETAKGEATGASEVANISVLFKGCKIFHLIRVNSAGLNPGEIQVNTLKGRLGYIEGKGTANPKVGVLLEPASGTSFTEFEFAELLPDHVVVGVGNATEGAFYEPEATGGRDGVISPIKPVNEMTHTFKQEYTVEVTGEEEVDQVMQNDPSHFEGEHNESLEWYLWNPENGFSIAWGPAGQELTNTNTVEGSAEIKA